MEYYDFGGILKGLRISRGMNQTEMGRLFGLSKAVVSKYENGLAYPNYDTLVCIAKHFGVSTDYLLGIKKSKDTLDVSDLSKSQVEALLILIEEFKKQK